MGFFRRDIADIMVQDNWPDIVLVDKKKKTALIIDIGVPMDIKIQEKEIEKWENTN